LDDKSRQTVYNIISREREAYLNKKLIVYHLTKEEIDNLKQLKCEFYANIARLTNNIFYYNGYFLPLDFILSEVFFDKHGLPYFSPKTLQEISNKDIIDAGGCIGDSAILFEREFTSKNVHCFEATKNNFNIMQKTLELNHSKRIIPVNKALGQKEGIMNITLSGDSNIGAASIFLSNRKGISEECQVITLDSYVKTNNIQVGFIKVDIEGSEMAFLQGAKETICAQKPAMSIAIYHNGEHFLYIKPLIQSWNLGYIFKIVKPINQYISGKTVLLCEMP